MPLLVHNIWTEEKWDGVGEGVIMVPGQSLDLGYTLNALALFTSWNSYRNTNSLSYFSFCHLTLFWIFSEITWVGILEFQNHKHAIISKNKYFSISEKYEEKDNAKIPPKYQCCF